MAGGTHVCATAKASNAPNSRNDSAGKIVKGVGSGQTRVRSNYWLEWPPKWLTRPTLRSHEAYVCIARTRKVSGPRMFRERGEFAADFKVFFQPPFGGSSPPAPGSQCGLQTAMTRSGP